MADHAIEHTTPRVGSIDRYSPAVLLSLALAFGALAQALFFRSALGVNVGIASAVVLVAASRLRPNGARVDGLDRRRAAHPPGAGHPSRPRPGRRGTDRCRRSAASRGAPRSRPPARTTER